MMEQDYVTREFYFHTLAYISFTIKSRTFVSRGGCCMRTCSILSSFLIHPRGYPLEITSHLPPLLILEIRVIFQYRLRTTSHHEIPIRCNSSNRAPREMLSRSCIIIILFVLLDRGIEKEKMELKNGIELPSDDYRPEENGEGVVEEGANII